ncbi:MAG: hypothetical protein LBE37_07630, partial [Sphingobacterium sp.]|nr:hypothetical protein [Sphingobacterium sp.]
MSSQARFVGDKLGECMVFAYPNSSVNFVQTRPFYLASASKLFYLDTTSKSLQLGLMSPIFVMSTVVETSKSFISKLTSYAVRPIRLHFVPLKVTGGVRNLIINIASKELGVREATGKNDGQRVEEYLRYTNLGKGYEWCASFV